ncbi:hypothetical protein [Acidisphaera sp. L21]|uniref:hypothetical protein n=1 Tax=Acidisphaera sp. L21 TaxID=1641851 RepID=UPI00131CA202|nr:hypothetical protein [Acidisphaera sp. L21]
MSDDTFGFSAARKTTAEKLRAIRPADTAPTAPELAKVDAVGDSLGFKTREDSRGRTLHRRKREIGPTVAINTRAPERVAEPFVRFCEDHRFSYWEGIEELMKRAKVD